MQTVAFDLDRPWRLSSSVSLRPERFGALAYSFDTRRLSFLKSRRLFDVVQSLQDHPTGRSACTASGADAAEIAQIAAALARLASTQMIVERTPS